MYRTILFALDLKLIWFFFLSAEYVVEFEDQGLKDRGWEELKRVEGNKMHAVLPLWPYMSYRFRVIAINDLGISDPSKPSDIHNTPAEGYMRFFNQMFHFFFHIPILKCK